MGNELKALPAPNCEDIIPATAALAISENGNQTVIPASPSLSATDEAELRRIFEICDVNKTGTIDKRELIKALRKHKEVADFFHLPETIRQEDGSRDAMEAFFQGADTNDDREMSWDELKMFWMKQHGSAMADSTSAEPSDAMEDNELKALPAPNCEDIIPATTALAISENGNQTVIPASPSLS